MISGTESSRVFTSFPIGINQQIDPQASQPLALGRQRGRVAGKYPGLNTALFGASARGRPFGRRGCNILDGDGGTA